MKTNETIFAEIKNQGFMTKQQMQLLKNRSNNAQADLFNYDILETIGDGYGIPLTEEQGRQGLAWLKKFQRKRSGSPYGYREEEIINNASPADFVFLGFYGAGKYFRNYLPIYGLNGMQYVPMAEPYIVG